jgi:hypothetical protein
MPQIEAVAIQNCNKSFFLKHPSIPTVLYFLPHHTTHQIISTLSELDFRFIHIQPYASPIYSSTFPSMNYFKNTSSLLSFLCIFSNNNAADHITYSFVSSRYILQNFTGNQINTTAITTLCSFLYLNIISTHIHYLLLFKQVRTNIGDIYFFNFILQLYYADFICHVIRFLIESKRVVIATEYSLKVRFYWIFPLYSHPHPSHFILTNHWRINSQWYIKHLCQVVILCENRKQMDSFRTTHLRIIRESKENITTTNIRQFAHKCG